MADIKKINVNGTIYDIIIDLDNFYNKQQTYSKLEVDNAIQTAINNITDGDEVSY